MRFSTTALLALPLLASAAESPFEQYKAKFQNFLGSLGASPPAAGKADAPAAAAVPSAATGKAAKAKAVEPKPVATLSLNTWKDTFYAPVQPAATTPEEWLVLVTGGNKTCFGRCGSVDKAFSEAAASLASIPSAKDLHLASVNCDDEPVLCNSWSANAGNLWLFQILPTPAPVEIYTRRTNLTTVTGAEVVEAATAADRVEAGWHLFSQDGYFHPFEGKLAKLGLSVPLGYFFWALNAIPSWGLMLIVSFISRTMMNRSTDPTGGRAGAAGVPRAAPAGDARS